MHAPILLIISTVTMVFATSIEVKPNPILILKEDLIPEDSKPSQDIRHVLEQKHNRNLNAGHHLNMGKDMHHSQEKTRLRSSHRLKDTVHLRTYGSPAHDSHPNIDTQTKLTGNEYIHHHDQPIRDHRYLRTRDNRIILSKIIRPEEYKKFPNHNVYLEHLSKARLTERQHHKHEAEHGHHHDNNPYFAYNNRDHNHGPCGCDEGNVPQYHEKQAVRHRGQGHVHHVLNYEKHLDDGYQVHDHTNTGHDIRDHEHHGHNHEHHAHDQKNHVYAHHNHNHGHHILNRWHETIFVYPMKGHGHQYHNHEHHHDHRHRGHNNVHHNEDRLQQVQDHTYNNQGHRLHDQGPREYMSNNDDHGHYQSHDDHTQHNDHHTSNHGYQVQEPEEHDHDHRSNNQDGHGVITHERRHHTRGHRVRE